MAIEEKKDGLFSTNLGDGLIDIPEKTEEVAADTEAAAKKEETVGTEDTGKPGDTGKTEEPKASFTQHEDGTIDIDEALQATIDAGQKKKPDEEDGTDIENTEKQNKEKASSDGKGSSDSSPSSSQYLAFAKDQASEGVFLDFTDKDWGVLMERNDGNEAAALRELSQISIREMVKEGVAEYKESVTDEDRALYEAKEKGLPVDKYGIAKRNYDKFSAIKVDDLKENEKLQIEVVSKGLEVRGFSKEEIAEEIEGYKALENLGAKAEKVLPLLPKKFKGEITDMEESATADAQSRKDKIRQGVARMKQIVDTTPEIIPGIKLNKPTRDKIMKSMTEPVARDDAGNALNPVMATKNKNPQAFEMMIHYYHQLGLFNIDENGNMKPDFSKITKTVKNETVDGLRNVFESAEKSVAGKPAPVKTTDDELDDFEKAFNSL